MTCTKCQQMIARNVGYSRTPKGPHHNQCPPTTADKLAREWWRSDGVYIDPDTGDVDWYDKRAELAQIAFIAGYKKGLARDLKADSGENGRG